MRIFMQNLAKDIPIILSLLCVLMTKFLEGVETEVFKPERDETTQKQAVFRTTISQNSRGLRRFSATKGSEGTGTFVFEFCASCGLHQTSLRPCVSARLFFISRSLGFCVSSGFRPLTGRTHRFVPTDGVRLRCVRVFAPFAVFHFGCAAVSSAPVRPWLKKSREVSNKSA
jgi:hypothetical protein